MHELTLTVSDAAALRKLFDEQLSKRRAFLLGAGGVEPQTACTLVVAHGARAHRIAAEVVYVKAEEPGRGVGLQLGALDADAMAELRAFVEAAGAIEQAPEAPESDDALDADVPENKSLYDRIRSLSPVDQQKVAANGTLSERITLERMFGPNVWDTLLRNPRITIPEIARIAKKGTIPRPLLEMIGANGSWIAAGEVQRAILTNPRSGAATIARVLGVLSRGDLVRATQQTAYSMSVRNAARKLLGG